MDRTGMLTAACICLTLACSCARQSAQQTTEDSLQRYLRARTLYAQQDLSQALELLLKNHDAVPGLAANSFLIGKIYYLERDLDQAEAYWVHTLMENPHHVDTRKWLARLYLQQGQCVEAGEVLRTALADSSEDPQLLVLMAKVKRCSGDLSAAIQLYQSALSYSDRMAEAAIDLAEIYGGFGLKDRATAELERARKLCTAESPLWFGVEAAMRELKSTQEEAP